MSTFRHRVDGPVQLRTVVDEQIDRLKTLQVSTKERHPASNGPHRQPHQQQHGTVRVTSELSPPSTTSLHWPPSAAMGASRAVAGIPMSPVTHQLLPHPLYPPGQQQPPVMPAPRQLPPFVPPRSSGFKMNGRQGSGRLGNAKHQGSQQSKTRRQESSVQQESSPSRPSTGQGDVCDRHSEDAAAAASADETTTPTSESSGRASGLAGERDAAASRCINGAAAEGKDGGTKGLRAVQVSGSREERDRGMEGTPCSFFLRTGSCAYGDRCKFDHPYELAPQVVYNKLGLPLRPGQPDCQYYLKTLSCAYGHTCKYNHPDFPTNPVTIPYPHSPVAPSPSNFPTQATTAMLPYSPPATVLPHPATGRLQTFPYNAYQHYTQMPYHMMSPESLAAMPLAQAYYVPTVQPQASYHHPAGASPPSLPRGGVAGTASGDVRRVHSRRNGSKSDGELGMPSTGGSGRGAAAVSATAGNGGHCAPQGNSNGIDGVGHGPQPIMSFQSPGSRK